MSMTDDNELTFRETAWWFTPSGLTPEKEKPWNFQKPPSIFNPTGTTPDAEKPTPIHSIRLTTSFKRPGRPTKHQLFPKLVSVVDEYVRSHGFEAHKSRAQEGRVGVGLGEILEHVEEEIPGIKISTDSISRLMLPPNRSRKSSKLFKCLIPAKVGVKRNSRKKKDKDSHSYNSRAKQLREMGEYFKTDVVVLSCDNKNKIPIGTLAVSRRHHVNKIYHVGDTPDYEDHDFPQRSTKITPSGYLLLQHKTAEVTFKDVPKRPRVVYPHNGPSFIVNRASEFHGNTIAQHIEDLKNILHSQAPNAKICVLLTDNGPDVTTKSLANILYYCYLWQERDLDVLIVASFCPGQSSYNPIEHMWSKCTDALQSVTLDGKLPAENVIPALQKIDHDMKLRKLAAVVNNAMVRLNNCWNDQKFGKFPITSNFKNCNSTNEKQISEDYDNCKNTLASLAKINTSALRNDLNLMMAHIDRRIDFVAFKKCNNCTYCNKHPATMSPAFDFLQRNPQFPCGIPDPRHPNHFYTFMDFLAGRVPTTDEPDGEMLRHANLSKRLATLNVRCLRCQYTYTSKADRHNHMRIFHSKSS